MEDQEVEFKLYELMKELQQNTVVLETALSPFNRLMENISKDMEQVSNLLMKICGNSK